MKRILERQDAHAQVASTSGYTMSRTVNGGSQQVTVSPGGGLISDAAGLLSFDNADRTLSGAPRFTSVLQSGASLKLTGTGMANLTYSILSTNSILSTTNLASPSWTTRGSANADSNGNFQFIDADESASPQRFYRVSWP